MELTKEKYEKELNGQGHRCGSYLREAFPIAFEIRYRKWVAEQKRIDAEEEEYYREEYFLYEEQRRID